MAKIKKMLGNITKSNSEYLHIELPKYKKTLPKLTGHPEAATQRFSQEKVFRKYAANLQENTHAEVRFQ